MTVPAPRHPATTILWIVLAILGASALLGLLAGSTWGWGGMMGAGWIMMLVPILLIVLLLTALSGGWRTYARTGESALATLERRYAAGEVSREEFLRVREDLRGGRAP